MLQYITQDKKYTISLLRISRYIPLRISSSKQQKFKWNVFLIYYYEIEINQSLYYYHFCSYLNSFLLLMKKSLKFSVKTIDKKPFTHKQKQCITKMRS